jgi:hypothetical protein
MENQPSVPADGRRYRTEDMKKLAIATFVLLCVTFAISLAVMRQGIHEPIPVVGTQLSSEFEPFPHGALASSTAIYHTYISPAGTFRVGVDATNIIRLVISTDDGFATPDGISSSSTLTDVQAVSQQPLIADGNFGYTIDLPSGWTARFDVRDAPPRPSTLVASVLAR